jgi:nicotinate-nucleotide adenylyltransferase
MIARRALFGGSFDPVHLGHLLVAERLRDLERLESVVFVPAWRSPHKRGTAAAGRDRLAMLRLAVRGNSGFQASDVELQRSGPSYTIDTVRAWAVRWQEKPVLLLGGDALLDLHRWHEADALLHEARIVVYARPGFESAESRAAELGVRYHAGVLSSLSSRTIRQLARRGHSLRYQVPETVRRYIAVHGLYAGGSRNRS